MTCDYSSQVYFSVLEHSSGHMNIPTEYTIICQVNNEAENQIRNDPTKCDWEQYI